MKLNFRILLTTVACLCSGWSFAQSPYVEVGRTLSSTVERSCQLDVITPLLFKSLTDPLMGVRTLGFGKKCPFLNTIEVTGSQYAAHKKTMLSWKKESRSLQIRANEQTLEHVGNKLQGPLFITPLGRMTIVSIQGYTYLYDNQEQHWCHARMPTLDTAVKPFYWYDRTSQNIIRMSQDIEDGPIEKTQHYLPELCQVRYR